MFQYRTIIVLTTIIVCFSNQIIQVESSGYILDKLRSFSQSVCDFFRPSQKSTTVAPIVDPVTPENSDATNYDIDVRLNADGPITQPDTGVQGNTRKLISVGASCPPGQRINKMGQCRPIY